MFDEDINSNCDAENETYEDFKFWQMVKELAGVIAWSIADFLDDDEENGNNWDTK